MYFLQKQKTLTNNSVLYFRYEILKIKIFDF
jgi:hypothetical protein